MRNPREALLRRSTLLRVGALTGLAGLAACSTDDGASPRASPTSTPTPAPAPTATSSATSTSTSAEATPSGSDVAARPRVVGTVATGLAVPWNIRFLPDAATPTALVSSRDSGEVVLVSEGSARTVGTLDVVSRVDEAGETGLLGLALHPSYAENRLVYAYLTTGSDNRVVRMTYSGGTDDTLGTPEPVLTGIETSLHHNGGGLAFGPDGMLYVSTGDAENTANAQDKDSLNGKVLRVTDTGAVPSDNPFGNEVWSYGHRNVEGLVFDDAGHLWASEFGDHEYDELNRIVKGRDYGWPEVEGSDGAGGYADPLAQWATDACSPSGIAVAAGRVWLGALQGQCLFSVVLPGTAGTTAGRIQRHLTGHGRLRAVSLAPDGSLWVATSNRDGRISPRSGDDRILRVQL